jgi:ribosome-binding protein aMBF1 (putative translation factor)
MSTPHQRPEHRQGQIPLRKQQPARVRRARRPSRRYERTAPPPWLEEHIIGTRLRNERRQQGMTVADVAGLLRVDRTEIRNAELGRFRVALVLAIGDVLDDRGRAWRDLNVWIRYRVEYVFQCRGQ